jgi:hypothetical protein
MKYCFCNNRPKINNPLDEISKLKAYKIPNPEAIPYIFMNKIALEVFWEKKYFNSERNAVLKIMRKYLYAKILIQVFLEIYGINCFQAQYNQCIFENK